MVWSLKKKKEKSTAAGKLWCAVHKKHLENLRFLSQGELAQREMGAIAEMQPICAICFQHSCGTHPHTYTYSICGSLLSFQQFSFKYDIPYMRMPFSDTICLFTLLSCTSQASGWEWSHLSGTWLVDTVRPGERPPTDNKSTDWIWSSCLSYSRISNVSFCSWRVPGLANILKLILDSRANVLLHQNCIFTTFFSLDLWCGCELLLNVTSSKPTCSTCAKLRLHVWMSGVASLLRPGLCFVSRKVVWRWRTD